VSSRKFALAAALVAVLAAATMLLAQQNRAPAHTRSPGAAPAALSDTALEKAIRARFAESKIAADKFEVHVQGGVATLEGRTDILQHKGTATRLARAAGSPQVVNRIQVSEAARARSAANLTQGRRRAQIKRGESRSAPRSGQ